MERLTQWYDDGKIRGVLVKDGYEENALQTIVTKIDECYAAVALLKEYEDTELTPEQIISIATELKEYKQLGLSPKRLSEHIAFCRRYHELFGAIDFNRLMELKERDAAKRVLLINGGIPVCPECGAKVLKHYTFCKDCGQKLDQ